MNDKSPFTGSRFAGGNWDNGFDLHFHRQGETVVAQFSFKEHHQGPPNIAHGGAIAALIDESMTVATFVFDLQPAYTVNLDINYRSPIHIGDSIRISAHIVNVDGRKVYLKSEILLPNDTLATEADGLFLRI
ncbi:MAG: PaaI family thioesterase [Chloroflexota bacterium]